MLSDWQQKSPGTTSSAVHDRYSTSEARLRALGEAVGWHRCVAAWLQAAHLRPITDLEGAGAPWEDGGACQGEALMPCAGGKLQEADQGRVEDMEVRLVVVCRQRVQE